jgi:hypothetical protein
MPDSIPRGKHADFLGPSEKRQIDKKMKEFGIHRSRDELMSEFWAGKDSD